MIEILGDRQSGKTTALITLFANDPVPGHLIVPHGRKAEVVRLLRLMFPERRDLESRVFSCGDSLRGRTFSRMYIDDLGDCDMRVLRPFLSRYLDHSNIVAFTSQNKPISL